MADLRFTRIEPGFVFEHEGVRVESVETKQESTCFGCALLKGDNCELIPCVIDDYEFPKQRHNLIFKEVENE